MHGRLAFLGRTLLDAEGNSRVAPAVITFLVLSALLLGGVMLIGPYPINLFATDTMHVLVHADILNRGERPYVDFYSLYGPVPGLFPIPGIQYFGVSLWAILSSQVLGAALFGTLMFKIAVSRLHGFWAVLLAVSVELMLVSCTPLGRRSWREFSSAMWYNALCFVITAIIFLYLLAPSRSKRQASQWFDAAIIGFCLMAALLTKISFFPPLLIIVVAGTLLWPRGPAMRLHGAAALLMGALMSVGLMASLGGSLSGYIQFIRSISLGIGPLALALRYVHHSRTIGTFAVCVALTLLLAHETGLLKSLAREWFLAFLMFGAMLAMTATCKQDPEALPLIGVIPLAITITLAGLAFQRGRRVNLGLAMAVLLGSTLLTVHDAKNGALSWVFSRMTIKTIEPPVARLEDAETRAKALVTSRVDPHMFAMMPKPWVEWTFAGLELLKASPAKPGEVLHVATIANSITLLTDFEYSHAHSPWSPIAAADRPQDYKPPVDDLLADVDWILQDHGRPDVWEFLQYYRGPYIEEHFVEVSHNDDWTLYGRRDRAGAGGSSP